MLVLSGIDVILTWRNNKMSHVQPLHDLCGICHFHVKLYNHVGKKKADTLNVVVFCAVFIDI